MIAALPLLLVAAAPLEPVKLLVPDPDNLQYLALWVARGAGAFAAEGLAVEIVTPEAAAEAESWMAEGKAEVAVLSPPMYLRLISEHAPVVLAANLLRNDAINLVARREVLAARKIDPRAPLSAKLLALEGAKIGVAGGPVRRLRALFRAAGLELEKHVEVVTVGGPSQNLALGEGSIDALYAHTPYLERAIVEQGAVVIVNQSAGEVPELAHLQIHALVATRLYAEQHGDRLARMVKALARAEKLIHADGRRATRALLASFPRLDRRLAEAVVALYAPAVPDTPAVSAAGIKGAAAFYPATREPPDLSSIDLAKHVWPAR